MNQRLATVSSMFFVSLLTAFWIVGCSNDSPQELVPPEDFTDPSHFADLKRPEAVASAPTAPTVGNPFVVAEETGYYHDWRLNKPLEGTAAPGTTIYMKVVFSEPMQHIVADDKSARPILYYRIDGKLTRYRMKPHGASGEHFQSGDAKPFGGGTDDYICKYTVPEDAVGRFVLAVGKFSIDTDGNTLHKFYTHKKKLMLGSVPPTVIEVGYYADQRMTEPLEGVITPETTIYTKVVFAESIQYAVGEDENARPNIFFEVGSGHAQYRIVPRTTAYVNLESGDARQHESAENIFICKYVTQAIDLGQMFRTYVGDMIEQGESLRIMFYVHTNDIPENAGNTIVNWQPDDFVGQVYVPAPIDGEPRSMARPISGVTVTIISGTRQGESTLTDRNGRYLFTNVEQDQMHLRVEKEHFEPKEVIVHRSRPTSLSNGDTMDYWKDPQKEPGNILIGQVWPDEVRSIFEETLVVRDLLYIQSGTPPEGKEDKVIRGLYGRGVIILFSNVHSQTYVNGDGTVLSTFAHEIAHAHQHGRVAIDGGISRAQNWVDTPEGRAFAEARRKDWATVGKAGYDFHGFISDYENAADTCSYYWGLSRWGAVSKYGNLEETAPNRFKWAEQWLKKK